MDKPWLKSGIQRLDEADSALIRESDFLYKEAIRGEMDWGGYGRTALEGGAGGAIGGALFGGVGAVPGAAIGAAGNVAIKGITDIWYNTRSNQDKASWQAGDLEERLNKLADLIQGQDSTLASVLKTLGNQYKEFVDGHIQGRKSENFQSNRFNISPEEMTQKFQQEYANLQNLRASSYESINQIVRIASSADNQNYFISNSNNSPSSNYGHDLGSSAKQLGTELGTGALGGNAGEYAVKKTVQNLAPNMLKGVGSLKSMGVGLVGELGVGAIFDAIENLQGAQKLYHNQSVDIQKIITEVNRLTGNDPQVLAAGNQVWTYVLEGKERIDNMVQNAQSSYAQNKSANTNVSRFKR